MQPKPEQQVGTTIVPAQEPEWSEVKRLGVELLTRSKDLRVACGLARASLHSGGLPGFGDGLSALRALVERYWDGVHPRLDPDDDNDATMRVNILLGLTEPGVLAAVRAAPIVSSRLSGRFTLKDIEIATGDVPAPAGIEPPTAMAIEGALLDSELSTVEAMATAARRGHEDLVALEAFVAERVGAERAPALGKLSALLLKATTFLDAALARRQLRSGPVDGAPENTPGANGTSAQGMASFGHGRRAGGDGEVRSREDVLRAMEKICQYYAKHEPSSPIPFFMERCQRLVSMNFVDIVRDLAPDALPQVETLMGTAK